MILTPFLQPYNIVLSFRRNHWYVKYLIQVQAVNVFQCHDSFLRHNLLIKAQCEMPITANDTNIDCERQVDSFGIFIFLFVHIILAALTGLAVLFNVFA